MSLLVRYTLASPEDHDTQISALKALVDDLRAEGIAGLHYSCFATEDPTRFIGLLEFPDDTVKQRFLESAAFAAYRRTGAEIFANPPEPTPINAIASTRD